MDEKHAGVLLVLVCLLFLSNGCTTWNKLVERNERRQRYDEFADMSTAEIRAWNADPANDEKIICRTEKPTGSNIPVRTCNWESEIRRRSKDDQRAVEELQRNVGQPGDLGS